MSRQTTVRGITTRLGLALASTALAALLLLGFQAPDDGAIAALTADGADSLGGTDLATGSSSTQAPGSISPRPTTVEPSATQVVDGSVVATRYGDVQVEISVVNGRIVSVTAMELPTGGHSGRISSEVEPILASEALAAQSASIDIVSGATYTSGAYARSLQAALDALAS